MHLKLYAGVLSIFAAIPFAAAAQLDGAAFASNLRAKYGPPLARETFVVRPGLEMVVDFADNGHVCRIQLPGTAPSGDPEVGTPQAVDEFVDELVPRALRGIKVNGILEAMGAPSANIAVYENVKIFKLFQDQRRTGVTITFSKEQCGDNR